MPKIRRPHKTALATVLVKNITSRTAENDLHHLFRCYSEAIADVYIPKNSLTGASEATAQVRFYYVDAARDAIVALDGCRLDGNVLELLLDHLPRSLAEAALNVPQQMKRLKNST